MRLFIAVVLLACIASALGSGPLKRKGTKFNCDCVDIIFNLDMSGSISDKEWRSVLQFVIQVMCCFNKKPNDVRFAVVKFTASAEIVFNLNDKCNDADDFEQCKNKVRRLGKKTSGLTDIKESLELISNKIIGSSGDRDIKRCPNIVILISDGIWSVGGDPIPAANEIKNKGTYIATIAISKPESLAIMIRIASDPASDFFFNPNSCLQLLKLVDDIKIVACDTIHFDPGCQTCCCGRVWGDKHRPYPDRKSKCCGTLRYDPKKATCCQGRLHEGFNEHFSKCCYYEAYDPKHFTCCYNRVVAATRSQDQCCRFTAYNQKHEICCNGWVFKKHKHTRCCGRYPYNPKWEICCRYIVNEGCAYDYQCCGRRSYNPHHFYCANPYYSYIRPSPVKFCGRDITLRCGRTFWDPLWNTCCAGKVHVGAVTRSTGCCRYYRYDIHKQLCCDGNLINKDPELFHCCGRRAFDPWKETCCHGYIVVRGLGLCCGYYRVFDHCNQICCGNYYVFPGRPCRTKCCYSRYFGYRPYDTKKQLCCLGFIQPGGKHYKCCRYYSYNQKTHMCCYGYIFSRKVFRLLNFCDNPRDGRAVINPFNALPTDQSQNAPEPDTADSETQEFEDNPEDIASIDRKYDGDDVEVNVEGEAVPADETQAAGEPPADEGQAADEAPTADEAQAAEEAQSADE